MGDQGDDGKWYAACARQAMKARNLVERAESFLRYLEKFPLGRHNRRAAESVEQLTHRIEGPEAKRVRQKLRALRDPHMPPAEPDTWDGD
ncbi:MAG: hypothetical protein JJ863_26720 [Deltaproteobacteria bacterium]|nr:hypothetical protein [Deltaproteobacteria bacterium]